MFLTITIIIIASTIDISITRISVFTGGLPSSNSDIVVFAIIAGVYAIGQYIILSFVRLRVNKNSERKRFVFSYRLAWISQYILIAILASVTLEMIFTSSYNILLLKVVIWINYVISIILMGMLAGKFFSWSRSSHSTVVISYAIAMGILAVSAIFTILYIENELTGQRDIEYVRPFKSIVGYIGGSENIFDSPYVISSLLSFILTWFATVLLMHHYSNRLGRVKYWIMVTIPLVYFLSQFEPLIIDVFAQLRTSDPVVFGVVRTLIFSAIKPVGGVLFGIAFWSVARSLTNETVRGYMMISAFGMILLFTSNQPIGLTLLPYPPFGLVSICFMGLSSYLIFVGIYSSALSVSQDSSLRQFIRRIALRESQLLDSIATAEMEKEIVKRVVTITTKNQDMMREETGVSTSLDEHDLKDYLQQVLEEVKKKTDDQSAPRDAYNDVS